MPDSDDHRARAARIIAEQRILDAARTGAAKLDLSGLGLTALPEAIGNLAQLQTLDVSKNQLTALPEAIGNLAQLQSLYAHANQLATLPEAIGNLAQLQDLYVPSNRLTALPETIGNLARLQSLYAYANQLAALPEALNDSDRSMGYTFTTTRLWGCRLNCWAPRCWTCCGTRRSLRTRARSWITISASAPISGP